MAKQKNKERPLFTRGYKELAEVQKQKSKFIRHCNSCLFYYADKGEKEEYCQNEHVLPYDVVQDGSNISCHYWKPSTAKELAKTNEEDNGSDYLSRFKRRVK